MKFSYCALCFLYLCTLPSVILAQAGTFEALFTTEQLRIDFILHGNESKTELAWTALKKEPFYGGSTQNLIDPFQFGEYRFQVFHQNQLVYSRGFATLFAEWQRTPEAKYTTRSFEQSIVMPFPQKALHIVVEARAYADDQYQKIGSIDIDPNDYMIQKGLTYDFPIFPYLSQGSSHEKIDLVIVAEGFQAHEMKKFRSSAITLMDYLFSCPPFDEHRSAFNIYMIESVSTESGTDIPGEYKWANTIVNSHFYTFRSERYLTSPSVFTLRNITAAVPCDQIIILVNTDVYGGGGIYNHYNILSAYHKLSPQVLVHELGHGLAALADEYTHGEDDYFNKSIEPWASNISTLIDFSSKWKQALSPYTPIPTPLDPLNPDAIGVYEGAGYSSKGIYRAYQNCLMRSIDAPFCPLCVDNIKEIIHWYTK